MKSRLLAMMMFCGLIALGILGRAASIQIWRDPRLVGMAKRQFQSNTMFRPRRGVITDRNGEPMAINVEVKSLAANPLKIEGRRRLARVLSRALEIPYENVLDRLTQSGKREFAWIKRHLGEQDLRGMRKLQIIDSKGELAEGLWLITENRRIYPHKELAGHVMGDVNLDSEGLEGIELFADQKLRGKEVKLETLKDALGRQAVIDPAAAVRFKDGEDVPLTIDASLQYSVEQELRNAVVHTGSRAGSVIVMNAMNGEILAMANEPAFDPNDKNVSLWRRRNHAITDGYEPGSTLKPVLLATALSHGWRLGDRLWAERGSFVVQGRRISEAEAHEQYEWLSLKEMIQHSSNVAAAKLALRLGAESYFNALGSFGFGKKTGIGFPGEMSGKILPRRDWSQLTLANVGFGQGLLVTPLQITRAYAAFLNGGWLIQPTLIKSPAESRDAPRRIMQPRVVDAVLESLKEVTKPGGTGVKAALAGYEVAGKTGTAQVFERGSTHYSKDRYIASFVGFALGVEPRLVIFTSLEEPKGVYYASETAAPLFSKVLQATTNRFSMPSLARADSVAPDGGLSDQLRMSLAKVTDPTLAEPEAGIMWHSTDPSGTMLWTMPLLRGLTTREAIHLLRGQRLKLQAKGVGVIRVQSPEPGALVSDGGTVSVTLGE